MVMLIQPESDEESDSHAPNSDSARLQKWIDAPPVPMEFAQVQGHSTLLAGMTVRLLQPLSNEAWLEYWIVSVVHPDLHDKSGVPIKEFAVHLKYLHRPPEVNESSSGDGTIPQLHATYKWIHWNRSGFIELWTNNKVSWRHAGETFNSPLHGNWEQNEDSFHITFHHRGQSRFATLHSFDRLLPGADSWVLRRPSNAAAWCILVPALPES